MPSYPFDQQDVYQTDTHGPFRNAKLTQKLLVGDPGSNRKQRNVPVTTTASHRSKLRREGSERSAILLRSPSKRQLYHPERKYRDMAGAVARYPLPDSTLKKEKQNDKKKDLVESLMRTILQYRSPVDSVFAAKMNSIAKKEETLTPAEVIKKATVDLKRKPIPVTKKISLFDYLVKKPRHEQAKIYDLLDDEHKTIANAQHTKLQQLFPDARIPATMENGISDDGDDEDDDLPGLEPLPAVNDVGDDGANLPDDIQEEEDEGRKPTTMRDIALGIVRFGGDDLSNLHIPSIRAALDDYVLGKEKGYDTTELFRELRTILEESPLDFLLLITTEKEDDAMLQQVARVIVDVYSDLRDDTIMDAMKARYIDGRRRIFDTIDDDDSNQEYYNLHRAINALLEKEGYDNSEDDYEEDDDVQAEEEQRILQLDSERLKRQEALAAIKKERDAELKKRRDRKNRENVSLADQALATARIELQRQRELQEDEDRRELQRQRDRELKLYNIAEEDEKEEEEEEEEEVKKEEEEDDEFTLDDERLESQIRTYINVNRDKTAEQLAVILNEYLDDFIPTLVSQGQTFNKPLMRRRVQDTLQRLLAREPVRYQEIMNAMQQGKKKQKPKKEREVKKQEPEPNPTVVDIPWETRLKAVYDTLFSEKTTLNKESGKQVKIGLLTNDPGDSIPAGQVDASTAVIRNWHKLVKQMDPEKWKKKEREFAVMVYDNRRKAGGGGRVDVTAWRKTVKTNMKKWIKIALNLDIAAAEKRAGSGLKRAGSGLKRAGSGGKKLGWIAFVKRVRADQNIRSYKEALRVASTLYHKQ